MRSQRASVVVGLWAIGTSMFALQPTEEYLGLGVSFVTVAQAYRATTPGAVVFYEGEPVRARVVLNNQTPQAAHLRERHGPWAEAGLVFHVSDAKERTPVATNVMAMGSRRKKAERAGTSLTLGPRGSEEVVFNVTGEDGRPLEPGDYRVRVVLDPSAVEIVGATAMPVRHEFVAGSAFKVAPIVSPGDRWNYMLHMAAIHRLGGNLAEAEAWLDKLLAINPSSIPALVQRGNMRRTAQNCIGAVESWSRALQLANEGADPEALVVDPHHIDEFRSNAQRLIARCGGR